MISRAQSTASGIRLDQLLELEQQGGVLVTGEQPEEHPVGELEGTPGPGPAELEQPPVLGDGADVLDALGGGRGEAEEVPAPDPGILLLLHHRERGLGLGHRQVGRFDRLRAGVPGGRQLRQCAITDRRPGVFEQPGQRNPVVGRQFQRRSWAGQTQTAAKIDGAGPLG